MNVWGVFADQVPAHMWCPTSLMVNGVETQYPVPEPALPLNFINSTGMCYEAEEVRRCLLAGAELHDQHTLHTLLREAGRDWEVCFISAEWNPVLVSCVTFACIFAFTIICTLVYSFNQQKTPQT